MGFEILALIMEAAGTIMIAVSVLAVHGSIGKEHGVDTKVERKIRMEHKLAIIGLSLVVGGFIFQFLFLFEIGFI